MIHDEQRSTAREQHGGNRDAPPDVLAPEKAGEHDGEHGLEIQHQ